MFRTRDEANRYILYLGLGETALRPAIGLLGLAVKQHVLLLDTEPRMAVSVRVHDLLASMTEVSPVRSAIRVVGFAEDELVVAAAEGISKKRHGLDQHIRIVALSLSGGRTIKVPFGKVSSSLRNLGYSLGLASQLVKAINPDILDLD